MVTRILVIDDEPTSLFVWEALASSKIIIDSFSGPAEVLRADPSRYDVFIATMQATRREGFRELLAPLSQVPLILIMPPGEPENAFDAVKWRAWEYLRRPFSTDDVRAVVRHVLQVQDVYLKQTTLPDSDRVQTGFVGNSPMMMTFYRQVARVADSMASVLIEGESGTGKELTARALHQSSIRRNRPYLVVHCGAIPETLLESELFGYERGAFTGADRSRPGLIESAQDGTLFLDEITEMTPSLQGKLLRFMQNGEVRRLGGNVVRHSAVRVVASTNRNLDQEIQAQRFRADLMFRFIVRLRTPPLREHKEDLSQLIDVVLKKIAPPGLRISSEAIQLLCAYDWPGNVRELENVLHRTYLFFPCPVIRPEHLPDRLRFPPATQLPSFKPLEVAERNQILQTIQNQGGNRSRTARILGIDRKTLRVKMQRYGLDKEEI